jgi:hypothetical protein
MAARPGIPVANPDGPERQHRLAARTPAIHDARVRGKSNACSRTASGSAGGIARSAGRTWRKRGPRAARTRLLAIVPNADPSKSIKPRASKRMTDHRPTPQRRSRMGGPDGHVARPDLSVSTGWLSRRLPISLPDDRTNWKAEGNFQVTRLRSTALQLLHARAGARAQDQALLVRHRRAERTAAHAMYPRIGAMVVLVISLVLAPFHVEAKCPANTDCLDLTICS